MGSTVKTMKAPRSKIAARRIAGDWTISRVLERIPEVLREEGPKSLWFKILGETIYRRAILLERPLADPLPEVTPGVSLDMALLDEKSIDDYIAFRPDSDGSALRRRLRDGHRCFVARHDGRIIHASWVATGLARIDYLNIEINLAAGDMYLYEMMTSPEFRGRKVTLPAMARMLKDLRGMGCQRLFLVIVPGNESAFRLAEKMGARKAGRLSFFKIGARQYDIQRIRSGSRLCFPPRGPEGTAYWDRTALSMAPGRHYLNAFLGEQKRRAYIDLIRRWGGVPPSGRVLKTDLFEDAMGPDSFLDYLADAGETITGIDKSREIVKKTTRRHERNNCHMAIADVRRLPFAEGSFALIISPSTLDHFPDRQDLDRSLLELARVLEPGGRMIITLDNRQNIFDPLLRLVHRAGWVPYYLGRSYSAGELRRALIKAGFSVEEMTAILHNPRLTAVALVALTRLIRWSPLVKGVEKLLVKAQGLEHTRFCYYTGSFVAARAVSKRGHGELA
jgi:SAM-dependent methyltransferase